MFDIENEFNLAAFIEDTTYRDNVKLLSRVIEHLLKIRFCTNNQFNKGWEKELTLYRNDFLKDINKDNKKLKIGDFHDSDKYGKYVNPILDSVYNKGVGYYNADVSNYPDLGPGIQYIPEKCPWTFAQLMNLGVNDLLDFLPLPDYKREV